MQSAGRLIRALSAFLVNSFSVLPSSTSFSCFYPLSSLCLLLVVLLRFFLVHLVVLVVLCDEQRTAIWDPSNVYDNRFSSKADNSLPMSKNSLVAAAAVIFAITIVIVAILIKYNRPHNSQFS